MNFNSISPRVLEISALGRQTDRQTDGKQSDLMRVPFFLKRYEILKDVDKTYVNIFYTCITLHL